MTERSRGAARFWDIGSQRTLLVAGGRKGFPNWLVGLIARAPTNQLELIRVADGLVLELPQFTTLDRPAWRALTPKPR